MCLGSRHWGAPLSKRAGLSTRGGGCADPRSKTVLRLLRCRSFELAQCIRSEDLELLEVSDAAKDEVARSCAGGDLMPGWRKMHALDPIDEWDASIKMFPTRLALVDTDLTH